MLPTPEKTALDALNKQINARLADGVQEESIGDRKVVYVPLADLIAQRDRLAIVVANQSTGAGRVRRNILGTFSRG